MNDQKENKLLQCAELNDEQLENAVGGTASENIIVQPMAFKVCANNKTHVYVCILDACPECGCTEFTLL